MFSFAFLNELPPDIGRITFQHITIEDGEKKSEEIPHKACNEFAEFEKSDHVKNLRCLDIENE